MSENEEIKEIAFRQREIAGILIKIVDELKEIKEAIRSAADRFSSAVDKSQSK